MTYVKTLVYFKKKKKKKKKKIFKFGFCIGATVFETQHQTKSWVSANKAKKISVTTQIVSKSIEFELCDMKLITLKCVIK